MDYTKISKPKPTEAKGMKWSDYFWSEGGWIGWILLYWLLFAIHFFDIAIPYITPINKEYLSIFFLIFGLILTKSAFHYRKNWNDRFKKLKNLYTTSYENRENEANNIFNKMKYLFEKYPENQILDEKERKELLGELDKYRGNFSNKQEMKQLRGDSDYET
jgi:hypothetical protein